MKWTFIRPLVCARPFTGVDTERSQPCFSPCRELSRVVQLKNTGKLVCAGNWEDTGDVKDVEREGRGRENFTEGAAFLVCWGRQAGGLP